MLRLASASSFASLVPSLIHSPPCGAPSNSADLASAEQSQDRSRTSELMLGDRLSPIMSESIYDVLILIRDTSTKRSYRQTDRRAFAHIGTAVSYKTNEGLEIGVSPPFQEHGVVVSLYDQRTALPHPSLDCPRLCHTPTTMWYAY